MVGRRPLVLAGSLLIAMIGVVAIVASSGMRPAGTVVSAEPTAATACRPFAGAEPLTDIGPLPPQAAWNALATGDLNGARSLAEAASISDLVVVGRWIGTERFGAIGDGLTGHYAIAVIGIDRLVLGTLPPGCVELVRVPFLLSLGAPSFPEADFATAARTRPHEPALLFLQSWAGAWDRAGGELPDWVAPLDRYDLYRTIGIDGALPLVGDRVSAIVFENDMAGWRLGVAEVPLDELLRRLADVAPVGPATPS